MTDLAELHFPAGLAGFPAAHRFALERWGGDDSPFSVLQSLDEPDLAFIVAVPNAFFPEYELDLDDDAVTQLDLRSPDDALVLVIVTASESAEDATANLLGPLVVNQHTREAQQIVLTRGDWDTRVPLVRSVP